MYIYIYIRKKKKKLYSEKDNFDKERSEEKGLLKQGLVCVRGQGLVCVYKQELVYEQRSGSWKQDVEYKERKEKCN